MSNTISDFRAACRFTWNADQHNAQARNLMNFGNSLLHKPNSWRANVIIRPNLDNAIFLSKNFFKQRGQHIFPSFDKFYWVSQII
ncbi:protein of unknown function (plasmid) [Azospirillum baldaniorum]|uniref:Uncharacterized protein n=1 Tax=Azospirillum baldaniorum TaxID=1064539 RepID=A0A9P1K1Z2_9PROT|nr:protein of unknown function [Azospirillum baldaniorum]